MLEAMTKMGQDDLDDDDLDLEMEFLKKKIEQVKKKKAFEF